MGYTTTFEGEFQITPPLRPEHRVYLQAFSETRRMKRIAHKTEQRPDPIRQAVGLAVGDEGGYFVGESGYSGQDHGPDVFNHNEPPLGQPGLWCDWTPDEDGGQLLWGGSEKFYSYTDWLRYLIEHFLQPWGYKLNGTVEWCGEDPDDRGQLVVTDNAVRVRRGKIVYVDEDE